MKFSADDDRRSAGNHAIGVHLLAWGKHGMEWVRRGVGAARHGLARGMGAARRGPEQQGKSRQWALTFVFILFDTSSNNINLSISSHDSSHSFAKKRIRRLWQTCGSVASTWQTSSASEASARETSAVFTRSDRKPLGRSKTSGSVVINFIFLTQRSF